MKNILRFSAILAMITGGIMICGAIWGISFTYKNITQEKIVTPEDASIPNAPLRGPRTLKSQADIIREHTLRITKGKTYAEMPRQIPKINTDGTPILNEDGEAIMIPNTARDTWITATALVTALNLGILTYAFSGLILLFGLVSVWTGVVFFLLSRKNIFL